MLETSLKYISYIVLKTALDRFFARLSVSTKAMLIKWYLPSFSPMNTMRKVSWSHLCVNRITRTYEGRQIKSTIGSQLPETQTLQ